MLPINPAGVITDLNQDLEVGSRYLFRFKVGGTMLDLSPDVGNKLSDYTNLQNELINNHLDWFSHFELQGTTWDSGNKELVALVLVKATPVILIAEAIVSLALIVAGVYLLITFKDAVKVVATDVGTGTTTIAQGVSNIGTGLGTALPVLAIAAGIFLVILVIPYLAPGIGTLKGLQT